MLEFRAEFFNVLNHPNFSGGSHFNVQVFNGSTGDLGPFSEMPGNGRVTTPVQDDQRENPVCAENRILRHADLQGFAPVTSTEDPCMMEGWAHLFTG